MRLLVVEDEKTLANLIKKGFEEEGFAVDVAYDGEDGLFLAQNNIYDCIVLDIMLPIIDGISILKKLREQNNSTPIIILTAKDAVQDKVLGLDSGSDDYLTKPFSFEELLSRTRAIVRRKYLISTPIIKIDDLEIDTVRKTVKRANKLIEFSAKEYILLEYLAVNKNKVVSRSMIIEHLYNEDFDLDSNVIDVFINRIRNKIDRNFGKQLIHTVTLPFIQSAKTVNLKGEPVRIFSYDFFINKKHFIVECAQDIDDEIDLLQTYLGILSIAILVAIVLSALGGIYIVNTNLKPLKHISNTISKLSESNLRYSHINENVATELKPLVIAFNRTFERLDRLFTKQKQFIADVSHEIKTPLSVILMETEIALRKMRSLEEYKNTINQIRESALHMEAIIKTLLKMIKIENTQLLEKKSCDIKEIILKSLSILKQELDKKHITYKVAGSTFSVEADHTLIMEVFLNILDNAIKYNREGGNINILISPPNQVEIVDSGFGIPKEVLDKVFDKFYRVDPSRSKNIEGLGLGLSLVKEILDLHNAKIEIESTQNIGTKATIAF